MKICTNKERVIKISVQGKIDHPKCEGYYITTEGKPIVVPQVGGITYNVNLGDSVFGWMGDHVEPGVSIGNEKKQESNALNILSCIGNEAIVISGAAKGVRGRVTGKHSGVEHVIIDFAEESLELMTLDDKILIKACGQGLSINGYDGITVTNVDPWLLENMNITINKDKNLSVPVVAKIPVMLMGSGIGMHSYRGDYDLITSDRELIRKHHLDNLKLGDVVLLEDCDNVYGRGILMGAVSVGIVVHSDSYVNGHGPGIVNILSSKERIIDGVLTPDANIKNYFKKI